MSAINKFLKKTSIPNFFYANLSFYLVKQAHIMGGFINNSWHTYVPLQLTFVAKKFFNTLDLNSKIDYFIDQLIFTL